VVQSRGNEVERPGRALRDLESGPRWSSSSVLDRSKGHDVAVQLESMDDTGLEEWGDEGCPCSSGDLECDCANRLLTVMRGSGVRLDLEITRGAPSSLSLWHLRKQISNDRFLSLISDL
jgi:hypothetical protein